MSNSPDTQLPPVLSREEIAWFIRSTWEALLKPNWKRSDLIDLGMAVFAKTTLAKMDQKKMGELLPYLSIVAEELGVKVRTRVTAEIEAALKAQEASHPAPIPSEPVATPTVATEASPEPATTPEGSNG
jgi:hypothetical protein